MGIIQSLSALTLRPLVNGACHALGIKAVDESVDVVASFLTRHFADQSQRLSNALRRANERAWKVIEMSLAGESFWERCQSLIAPKDQQAFRNQVRGLMEELPKAVLGERRPEQFCQSCLYELRAARQSEFLQTRLDTNELARQVGAFARFGEPERLLQAELQGVQELAEEVRRGGYGDLAAFLALRPAEGPALLVSAVRYFLRREVETDRELF